MCRTWYCASITNRRLCRNHNIVDRTHDLHILSLTFSNKDTEKRGLSTRTSYIQSYHNVVVDRIHDLYIFSLTFSNKDIDLFQKRYRATWIEHTNFIYSVLSSPNKQHCGWNTLPSPNKDTEATTLWIEHTTLSQQRYRGNNNIVDRIHDLHILCLTSFL